MVQIMVIYASLGHDELNHGFPSRRYNKGYTRFKPSHSRRGITPFTTAFSKYNDAYKVQYNSLYIRLTVKIYNYICDFRKI